MWEAHPSFTKSKRGRHQTLTAVPSTQYSICRIWHARPIFVTCAAARPGLHCAAHLPPPTSVLPHGFALGSCGHLPSARVPPRLAAAVGGHLSFETGPHVASLYMYMYMYSRTLLAYRSAIRALLCPREPSISLCQRSSRPMYMKSILERTHASPKCLDTVTEFGVP